jgi:hypothetical protein
MQFLICQKAGLRRLVLLFSGFCLCWMLSPMQARAATGTIADDAQVLNTTTIRQYTDQFSYTVDIFTTRDFQGSNDAFDASVQGLTSDSTVPTGASCDPKHQVGGELFSSTSGFMWRNSDATQSIEIGIDVPVRHLAIYSGKGVTITQDHYNNAIQAFADTMHQTHDNYTQATIAALNDLQNANDRFWDGVRAQSPWFLLGALVVGAILFSMFANAMGWKTSSSDGYESRRNYNSRNNGGGGGNSGGGGFGGGGGGGGGASGNF